MFPISSIGKLQKITKIFTLFYKHSGSGKNTQDFPFQNDKYRSVLPMILLHFDIFVNSCPIKIFLSFLF